jgi:hypothetical protein
MALQSKPMGRNLETTLALKRKLSEKEIEDILLSRGSVSGRKLGKKYGISPTAIQNIWNGLAYASFCPGIERKVETSNKSCEKCVHMLKKRCSMNFPEYSQNGNRAAKSCNTYSERRVIEVGSILSNY